MKKIIFILLVFISISTNSFQHCEIRIISHKQQKYSEYFSDALNNSNDYDQIIVQINSDAEHEKKIYDSLSFFHNLKTFEIRSSNLGTAPNFLERLYFLEKVIINNCSEENVKLLLTTLSKNPRLVSLDLQVNKLSTVPIEILNLETIEIINLRGNEIRSFPDNTLNLRHLKYLLLDNNKIEELPLNVENLEQLEYLSLNYNPQINLLTSFCRLSKLKNMRSISITSSSIKRLPDNIYLLENIEELQLNNNQLSSLPSTIAKLKKLKYIDLSSNKISSIPQSFKKLPKGVVMDLTGNKISLIKRNRMVRDFRNIKFSFNALIKY